jgi:hypothetical protein
MFKIDETYSDYYKTDPVKYPGGGAINSSGVDTTDGTPWLAKMFDNCVGWMQALYIKAFGSLTGISGEAENAQTSDVVRALDKIRGDNNAAERTISENTYFKKAGGVIGGDTSIEGQLHVKGDLLVDGTGEEIITTELKVGANTITLRDGNPTGLATNEIAGVVTHNYDGQGNNNIIAVDAAGNARVGDIDIATRLLYSNDGNNFFEDEDLTVAATIGQDEVVRDTGNTTSGGVKIYEGTTFSNNNTQPMATREEEANMVNGYGVTWNARKKCLETTFIPSGAVIPQNIQADTTISGIVADRCVYITAVSAVTLTIGNAAQPGIKIRIINTTSLTHTLLLASVSINVPHVLPMANVEIMWNGTAWQHIGGCAVGETFEQKPQCDSPFDVSPCSEWEELSDYVDLPPKKLYELNGVYYSDVERLNPVNWQGLKNADGSNVTVVDTGDTQFNSRGEEMKIYEGSWPELNYKNGVGEIVSFYKKGNYPNYLYCDGRDTTGTDEELASHYPALYKFLGTNVLPDYRECVIVGAEQNTTDAIAEHDVYTQGQFKDDQFQGHEHGGIKAGAETWSYALNGIQENHDKNGRNGPINTTSIISKAGYGDVRYGTTTHGKQKAAYYYVKAVGERCKVYKRKS